MKFTSAHPIEVERNYGVSFAKITNASVRDQAFLAQFGTLGEIGQGVFVLMVDFTRWKMHQCQKDKFSIRFERVKQKESASK